MLDNNLKCVDLSDLEEDLPLDVTDSKQILWQSEDWEYSTWDTKHGRDSLGYPTVCPELRENQWRLYVDRRGDLIPVFPTTAERWMNSQSSYHAVQRLRGNEPGFATC